MQTQDKRYFKILSYSDATIGVKLISMGVAPGKKVAMLRSTMGGNAFIFACDNARFALSKEDLQGIQWEELELHTSPLSNQEDR